METLALFATPVFISDEYALTPAEDEFLRRQAWRSNAGGNQSSADSHVLDHPEVAGLRAFLQSQVELVAHQLLKVQPRHQLYITQSWMNRNEKGARHHPHAHQNSILSGVYYLDGDDSPIVFVRQPSHYLFGNVHLTFSELNMVNAGECDFAARRHHTVLFPSTTQHYVRENRSDVPRMSLAYNTFVRGPVGDVQELTELSL